MQYERIEKYKKIWVKKIKPDSVLLSHGETPHYHRRCTFSLLSSKWYQVVQVLYSHQAILFTMQS